MSGALLDPSQAPFLELEPLVGTPLGRRLSVLQSNGERAVALGSTVIHLYDATDRAAEAAAIALLARAHVATDTDLANAFHVHRNTVGRLERRLQETGMAGVVPAKRGPKGPHKVTPAVMEIVRECSHLGCVKLARQVEQRTGVRLHVSRVSQLLRQVRAATPAQEALLPEPEAEPEPAMPEAGESREPPVLPAPALPGEEPAVVLPEQARGRYMGAALYYPALESLGLLEAAATCFRLPKSDLFGVRAVTLTLFFLSLFSKTTLEAAKNFRIGLYAADTDWQPIGAPLLDSGDISAASTGVKTYTPATPVFLARGRYVSVLATDATGTAVWRVAIGYVPGAAFGTGLGSTAALSELRATRTYAAFPTPGQQWSVSANGNANGNHYAVFFRVLTP